MADTFRESQPAWHDVKKVYVSSTHIGSNSSSEQASQSAFRVEQESKKLLLSNEKISRWVEFDRKAS